MLVLLKLRLGVDASFIIVPGCFSIILVSLTKLQKKESYRELTAWKVSHRLLKA